MPGSARPTELQLGTLEKNLAIQSPMPAVAVAAVIAMAMRTAKMISTTTSSKESRTRRQLLGSDCWKH